LSSDGRQTFRFRRTRGHGPSYTIGSRPPLFVFKLGGSIVPHFFANFLETVGNIAILVSPQDKARPTLRSAPTVVVLRF